MANYTQRLAKLRNRRLGIDSPTTLAKSLDFAERSRLTESYERRGKTDAIKYALGAMQELEPKYTAISIEEGERVRNQLQNGLAAAGIPVSFEPQGSVPINIHIRFASDVDLLVLHEAFVTLDWAGPGASTYTRLSGSTPLEDVTTLRSKCEFILEQKFPAVKVDKSGAKSICLTGGSLQRKVDVVPSHWHDTAAYQASKQKRDREVKVLNKESNSFISNRPFMHMHMIEGKDAVTGGGSKKVIRLLKSVKNDSDRTIEMSSYEIASLVWHFNAVALIKPTYLDLALVAETQNQLNVLVSNPSLTQSLLVPDGSRKIIDSSEKFGALQLLKREIDELVRDLAKELNPFIYANDDLIRKSLLESVIY